MTDINLQSITFPGINNKYKVPEVDNTLTVAGKAADAKSTGDALGELNERIGNLSDLGTEDKTDIVSAINEAARSGITDEVKVALLACFEHVIWNPIDGGRSYYDALESALYPVAYPKIEAVFNSGGNTIYTTASIDSLKQYLTVLYFADASSSGVVVASSDYTLSGTLSVGSNRILVSYQTYTTTFTVFAESPYLYKLPSATIFTGDLSEAIDTNVALFETDQDYTIIAKAEVDFTPQTTSDAIAMFGNIPGSTSALPSWRTYLQPQYVSASYVLRFGGPNNQQYYNYIFSSEDWRNIRFRNNVLIGISHVHGSSSVTVRHYVDGTSAWSGSTPSYNYEQTSASVTVGCRRNAAGEMQEPFKGTINEFEIYKYAMTQNEMDAVLGIS